MYMNTGHFEYIKDSQIKQQMEHWYIMRRERNSVCLRVTNPDNVTLFQMVCKHKYVATKHMNPTHTLSSYLLDTVYHLRLCLASYLFPSVFPTLIFYAFLITPGYFITNSPWFNYPKNLWWQIQVLKVYCHDWGLWPLDGVCIGWMDLLHLYTQLISRSHDIAIVDLHTLQFIVTLGFSVFIGLILATDFNTVIIPVSL
jgi:hypothetical protein